MQHGNAHNHTRWHEKRSFLFYISVRIYVYVISTYTKCRQKLLLQESQNLWRCPGCCCTVVVFIIIVATAVFFFHSFRKKSALPGKISNCTRLMKPKVLLHVRSICVVRFAWWVTSVTPADEIRWELLFLNINKSTIFHIEFH